MDMLLIVNELVINGEERHELVEGTQENVHPKTVTYKAVVLRKGKKFIGMSVLRMRPTLR